MSSARGYALITAFLAVKGGFARAASMPDGRIVTAWKRRPSASKHSPEKLAAAVAKRERKALKGAA